MNRVPHSLVVGYILHIHTVQLEYRTVLSFGTNLIFTYYITGVPHNLIVGYIIDIHKAQLLYNIYISCHGYILKDTVQF